MAIKLPARLFNTLLCLVQHRGALVERDTLMQAVWPGRVVDEGSLGRAVSSLRAALKEHGAPESLIVTATGRGYRLGALVSIAAPAPTLEPVPDVTAPQAAPPPANAAPPRARRAWLLGALGVPVLATLAALAWRGVQAPAPPAATAMPPPHSVAVLPFANMSDDPKESYLADGIADELINAMGRIGALRVAARRSSFLFKGRDVPIGEIARQLNVGDVLEGSVRREGARVRITAQLIDAATGYQVWSHSYDRDQGDILALEGEIAESVITSLQVVLLPNDAAKLTMGGTSNPRAFDAFLSGLTLALDPDLDVKRKAIPLFTTAIALDPNYAMAYVERANTRAAVGASGPIADVTESRRMIADGLADAEHAIALAPELGEAHAALGYALRFTLSGFTRGAEEYARALELAPGNARILRTYALFQLDIGHIDAGIEAAEHAASLDPLTPQTYRALARTLADTGRYTEAIEALHSAQRLPPADPAADRVTLGFIEMFHGDAAAARPACEGRSDYFSNYCLAWAYHALGRPADAQAQLDKLRAKLGDNGAIEYADIYAGWGETDTALQWLHTAYKLRDPGLVDIRFDPWLKPLSKTAEYMEIERRLDFPP